MVHIDAIDANRVRPISIQQSSAQSRVTIGGVMPDPGMRQNASKGDNYFPFFIEGIQSNKQTKLIELLQRSGSVKSLACV